MLKLPTTEPRLVSCLVDALSELAGVDFFMSTYDYINLYIVRVI